jgi:hypothetical protein
VSSQPGGIRALPRSSARTSRRKTGRSVVIQPQGEFIYAPEARSPRLTARETEFGFVVAGVFRGNAPRRRPAKNSPPARSGPFRESLPAAARSSVPSKRIRGFRPPLRAPGIEIKQRQQPMAPVPATPPRAGPPRSPSSASARASTPSAPSENCPRPSGQIKTGIAKPPLVHAAIGPDPGGGEAFEDEAAMAPGAIEREAGARRGLRSKRRVRGPQILEAEIAGNPREAIRLKEPQLRRAFEESIGGGALRRRFQLAQPGEFREARPPQFHIPAPCRVAERPQRLARAQARRNPARPSAGKRNSSPERRTRAREKKRRGEAARGARKLRRRKRAGRRPTNPAPESVVWPGASASAGFFSPAGCGRSVRRRRGGTSQFRPRKCRGKRAVERHVARQRGVGAQRVAANRLRAQFKARSGVSSSRARVSKRRISERRRRRWPRRCVLRGVEPLSAPRGLRASARAIRSAARAAGAIRPLPQPPANRWSGGYPVFKKRGALASEVTMRRKASNRLATVHSAFGIAGAGAGRRSLN